MKKFISKFFSIFLIFLFYLINPFKAVNLKGGFLMSASLVNPPSARASQFNSSKITDPIVSKVIEKKLPSGLTFLFYPYEREKVVTVKLCVKVGSSYETEKQAGITHLIEHMIFKGTKEKGPEEIAGAIEKEGGYMNAFTSYDYTCYYVAGPSKITETALEVLSDAVFHPYFPPEELKREKEVVIEEMKMRLDNPATVLFETLMSESYTKYPYRRPIIGYEKTVRHFSREDLLNYVNEFYTPENMVLVIVGDIGFKKVYSLVKKYFSHLPERKLKKVSFPRETYVSHPVLKWIKRDVEEGYFAFSFPAPSIKSDDAPVMDIIAEILGGGESSKLYKRLKRDLGIVKSISASAMTPTGPGLFEIFGTADPENFKSVINEVLNVVKKLKEGDVSQQELEKAKLQVLSDFIYSQETSEGLSGVLGSFELTRGTYKDIIWYKNRIKETTLQDVIRVANKYFNFEKFVACFLSKEKLFGTDELLSIIKNVENGRGKPEIFTLKNGLKVILYPERDIPTVAMSLVFPGGLRFETSQTDGLFQALSLLWTRGTTHYTAEQIAEKLDSIAGSISGFSGRNTFGLKAQFLSSKFDEGLRLFKEIVLNPSFPEEECEKARPELISRLLTQQDHPVALAIKDFMKILFPEHPYGLNPAGSLQFYQHFHSEDLKKAYHKFVNPEYGVLTVVGDFDPFYVKHELEELFKNWKAVSEKLPSEKEPPVPEKHYLRVKKDTYQTQILLGFQTPGLNSREKEALEVLSSALSGQEGRLFKILREKEGLAYVVTPVLIFYPEKSAFIFYIACSPEKEKEAIEGFWKILEDIYKNGLTREEIRRAKNIIIGRIKLGLQSNLSKAEDMSVNEVLHLGWDYSFRAEKLIKNVSQRDIKNIIKKYLKKENAVLFVLGR